MTNDELQAELNASRKNNFLLQQSMQKIIDLVHKHGDEDLKLRLSRLK